MRDGGLSPGIASESAGTVVQALLWFRFISEFRFEFELESASAVLVVEVGQVQQHVHDFVEHDVEDEDEDDDDDDDEEEDPTSSPSPTLTSFTRVLNHCTTSAPISGIQSIIDNDANRAGASPDPEVVVVVVLDELVGGFRFSTIRISFSTAL